MEKIILDSIPFEINSESLARTLRIKRESDDGEFDRLVSEAGAIARPKALYGIAFIESRGDDHVVVEGIKFKSRVLQVNLKDAHRVFPFVATCGAELEEWANSIGDTLRRFWAEAIMGMGLYSAIKAIDADIGPRYGLSKISHMSPGSLADWPIEEQGPLFELLGDTKASVGVGLRETFLMTPLKTVSGIRFPTEVNFESCQLCPRDGCPGRRAPYEADLYEKKYRK